ncbi:hypothetical protein, partial [Paraburkholderia mimosarum]|uniref:hypothetical protein n=1 Tax=Paraburkholderia mimosarum TaxID=312026 RepID=UPI001EE1AC03
FKPVRKTVRSSTEFHRPTCSRRTQVIHNLFQEKHAHFGLKIDTHSMSWPVTSILSSSARA